MANVVPLHTLALKLWGCLKGDMTLALSSKHHCIIRVSGNCWHVCKLFQLLCYALILAFVVFLLYEWIKLLNCIMICPLVWPPAWAQYCGLLFCNHVFYASCYFHFLPSHFSVPPVSHLSVSFSVFIALSFLLWVARTLWLVTVCCLSWFFMICLRFDPFLPACFFFFWIIVSISFPVCLFPITFAILTPHCPTILKACFSLFDTSEVHLLCVGVCIWLLPLC